MPRPTRRLRAGSYMCSRRARAKRCSRAKGRLSKLRSFQLSWLRSLWPVVGGWSMRRPAAGDCRKQITCHRLPMRFNCYIFDFDGTLAHSEPAYREAFLHTIRLHTGLEVDEAEF